MAENSEQRDVVPSVVEVFQPLTVRLLTAEDGRQIASNLIGFVRVLSQWQSKASACRTIGDRPTAD